MPEYQRKNYVILSDRFFCLKIAPNHGRRNAIISTISFLYFWYSLLKYSATDLQTFQRLFLYLIVPRSICCNRIGIFKSQIFRWFKKMEIQHSFRKFWTSSFYQCDKDIGTQTTCIESVKQMKISLRMKQILPFQFPLKLLDQMNRFRHS